jgi:hypothetical protein
VLRGRSTAAIAAVVALVSAQSAAGSTGPPTSAKGGRSVPAQVVSSTANSVVFQVKVDRWALTPSPVLDGTDRVSVPGFVSRGEPGEPSRPARKYLVGLPAEGTWTLSWRVLETASLGSRRLEPAPFQEVRREGDIGVVPFERYEIESEIYDAFRSPPVVSTDEPAWIRRQRVLPVWVEPLTYDPATGEAVLTTSVEITISFFAGRDEKGDQPGAPRESSEWQDVFSRLLVNAGQARDWQLAPRPHIRSRAPQRSEAVLQTDVPIKLRVKETGIHKVSAGALIAAGYPSGQPLENLHLFKRGYDGDAFVGTMTDVPFTVSEGSTGTPGVFDGQDAIIFHGLRPRDDASLEDPFEVYSGHSLYWLGTTSGTTMTDRVLTPGFLSADTASAWFPVDRIFVDDQFFREETPVGNNDYYYYNGYEDFTVDFHFEMETVRPGSFVTLSANLHGGFRGYRRSITTRLVNSQTDIVINPGLPVDYTNEVNHQVNLSGDLFAVGDNTFHFERESASDLPVHVFLNWLQVSYEALYRARGNMLHFNTATLTGDTSITVTGLSEIDDLWLFDVSDPLVPVNCVLDGALFTDVGLSHVLTFRDAISVRKDYVLVPQSRMIEIQNSEIEQDSPSAIVGDPAEMGVDVLVISHGDFIAGMQDWVRYRRAQGYRVLMVDVEDVYDEFNGGVQGRRGIDRFIRHFFELGNAGYVVLIGDGSEDHKQVHANSAPDFIPSPARTEYVGGSFDEYEVVTLDKYFVQLPGPGGSVDRYPDLVIGRIPVGSTSELQRVLNKVYRYEQPSAAESWRRRMIIVSDDAWSGGFETVYRRSEKYFESYQDSTARIIERTHPGMFDVIRFYLSEYSSRITSDTTQSYTMYYVQEAVRRQATPVLMHELEQGATLVTVQAHMNRSLITHEWLLTTMAGAVPTPNKDHQRMDNRDKPYIIFGMGCHFSDYALHRELGQSTDNSPNGDSFAEQLLFQNREGAVGTYGSTGFEYLNQVNEYCLLVANVWFYDAPYDIMIDQTKGRWVFGPLMFLVEAAAIGDGQSRPVDRYHILGDPLLRIDAGAPRMEVTVNGQSAHSGDNVSAGIDTIRVVANVADENVIEKFELLIDGQDMSPTLDVTPIGDESIPFSRRYEVRFEHALQLQAYDIVLRALQAPDTTAGQYHMAAEFVLHVPSNIELSVNGRLIYDGDAVPRKGNYRIRLAFPVYIPSSEISIKIDDEDVNGLTFTHPSPEDTTTWFVEFSKELDDGRHELVVTAGTAELSPFTLFVSSAVGLRDVINYPNPFSDVTQFLYSNDVEIDEGTIDVFTVSGKKIVQLEIPPDSRMPGQNGVLWNGRDAAGDEIANGVYLYVIRVQQRGQSSTIRGKLARMK